MPCGIGENNISLKINNSGNDNMVQTVKVVENIILELDNKKVASFWLIYSKVLGECNYENF